MKNEDFIKIYMEYKAYSAKVVFRAVKDRGLADDISQEAMIKLFQMGNRLETSNKKMMESLVFTISMNKVRDYYRKANVKREVFKLDETNAGDRHGNVPDPLEILMRIERKEHQKLILERLRKKKPMDYDIIMKVKVWNIPPASVAKEYGMSVNTLNNRIFRTKRWLKREMSRIYDV